MFEFRCTDDGLYYYDPILRREMFASNSLLFLVGYSRVFGDTKVSDKLFLPNILLDYRGDVVALANTSFLNEARSYMSELGKVESLDTGDMLEIYGLPIVLESLGFYNFYKSSSPYQSSLDRVPHVPLFTKRSQDYTRIYNILTQKKYWNIKENREEDIYISEDKKGVEFISPKDSIGLNPLYSVYNENFKEDRAEYLDLYNSFGSSDYMKFYYDNSDLSVKSYDDYSSWFIWNSFSFTTLYQFSLGVLYGMSMLGWGYLPFSVRPSQYYSYFKYKQIVDEAFFWFQNTPIDSVGENRFLNIDAGLFRIDTYPNIEVYRVLSSSVDQEILWDLSKSKFSLDNGETWLNKRDFQVWCADNNDALPVMGSLSNYGLWVGDKPFIVPTSDWEW